MTQRTVWRLRWPFAVLVAASGCGGGAMGGAAALSPTGACVAVEAALGPDGTLEGMAGRYRLTMVRTSGSRAGSAEGPLALRAQPEGLRELVGSSTPLAGSLAIDLRVVGAQRVGPTDTADPEAPGVLVIESDGPVGRTILLRLGSEANRRDVVAFDRPFTVLDVHRIYSDGFAGGWRSGGSDALTDGHFCALLVQSFPGASGA